jgi:hypothetical protein
LRQCTPSAVAHRYVLALAALVPNQAAFPDTARLLPVMVPTLAHAWRLAGLLNSSSSAPWRTTAYTGPRGGRMKPAAMTSFSSVPAAWGTHGGPVGAMLVGLVT